MQSQNRLLDDLARVASGALGVAAGVRGEAEARLREQFECIIQQMDLVTREDYDAAFAMAQNAREEQEALAERLATLESRLATLEAAAHTHSADAGEGAATTAKSGAKSGAKSTKSTSPKKTTSPQKTGTSRTKDSTDGEAPDG